MDQSVAITLAKEREAFGRPIGQNQAIAIKIARMGARAQHGPHRLSCRWISD